IIHFYPSVLVGTVALLLAITAMLNIFFPLGLSYGLQHFLSYHLGRNECGVTRVLIAKFLVIGIALSSFLFMFLRTLKRRNGKRIPMSCRHENPMAPKVKILRENERVAVCSRDNLG
ncbi:MAG: hypothetical protein QXV17_14535, partial [Candidatus Micrarchaeaceae archaeon]